MTKQDYIKLQAYELQVAQMVKFRMTQTIPAFAYCEEEYTKDCVIKEWHDFMLVSIVYNQRQNQHEFTRIWLWLKALQGEMKDLKVPARQKWVEDLRKVLFWRKKAWIQAHLQQGTAPNSELWATFTDLSSPNPTAESYQSFKKLNWAHTISSLTAKTSKTPPLKHFQNLNFQQ